MSYVRNLFFFFIFLEEEARLYFQSGGGLSLIFIEKNMWGIIGVEWNAIEVSERLLQIDY